MHVVYKPGVISCTGKNFECPNCGIILKTPYELQHQMKTNHEQENALSLISHNTEIKLLLHEKVSVNLYGLYFNCSICGNIYNTIDDLTQHVDTIHGHSESSTNFACGGSS